MKLLFEIIGQILQVCWATIKCFATAIWENIGTILELKKIFGYFTPAGMIALCIGVPTVVVSAVFFIVKKVAKSL